MFPAIVPSFSGESSGQQQESSNHGISDKRLRYRKCAFNSLQYFTRFLGIFTAIDGCNVDPNEIKYTLYNKNYSAGISPFTKTNLISDQPIFVLFHGWTDDSTHPWIIATKAALIAKYPDSNIIIIDYGKYSKDPLYYFTWCTAPDVGIGIAAKFHTMEIPTDKVTAIGFSIGAQVAGVVGRQVKSLGMPSIAVIIALEAAGIGYDKPILLLLSHEYLKSGDAEKVIGIYSNRKGIGMNSLYADINVFINDGNDQDCPLAIFCPILNPWEAVKPCIFCQHLYARETFIRAISMNPEYIARECTDFNSYASCTENTKFVLKALVPENGKNGLYFIKIDKSYTQIE